jgi:hypothetical protein
MTKPCIYDVLTDEQVNDLRRRITASQAVFDKLARHYYAVGYFQGHEAGEELGYACGPGHLAALVTEKVVARLRPGR